MKIAIKLNAGHDVNGNPRRGWLVYDGTELCRGLPPREVTSDLLAWIEEEYRGDASLREAYPNAHVVCELSVPFAEVKAARAWEKAQRKGAAAR